MSATNGTTRGERSQQLFPAARAWQAWQADIDGLRKQLKEEWETKLEEQKRKHNLEVKQLEKVKRKQEYQKQLKEEARLEYDEMSRKRDEERERKNGKKIF